MASLPRAAVMGTFAVRDGSGWSLCSRCAAHALLRPGTSLPAYGSIPDLMPRRCTQTRIPSTRIIQAGEPPRVPRSVRAHPLLDVPRARCKVLDSPCSATKRGPASSPAAALVRSCPFRSAHSSTAGSARGLPNLAALLNANHLDAGTLNMRKSERPRGTPSDRPKFPKSAFTFVTRYLWVDAAKGTLLHAVT